MFEEHRGEKAVLKPYYIAGITNNKSTQNWCAQQGRLSIIGATSDWHGCQEIYLD